MLFLLFALSLTDTTKIVSVTVAPGESLSVTLSGDGSPVVFLPGLFGSSYGYRHVMASLDTAGFRSVAVEPLGMGRSSRPEDGDYSLTAQAARIGVVLDSLDLSHAVFVGHSLGASMAMRLAYQRPDLVRGIVSLEGGPAEPAATAGFKRWMRFAPATRLIDVRPMMQRMIYRDMKNTSFDDSWVTDRVVLEYTAGFIRDHRSSIKAYQGMARSDEPEKLADHLEDISCPVVLLVGGKKHDSGPPEQEVQTLLDNLTSFSIDTIPASGYFIQEEQPAAVVEAIIEMPNTGSCGGESRSANQ